MTAQPSAHVLQQDLVVDFSYPVHFTRDVFAVGNPALSQCLQASVGAPKLLVFVERAIVTLFPDLPDRIVAYAQAYGIDLVDVRSELAGGEAIKQDLSGIEAVWKAIYRRHIDRHSYVMAIGGGAFLDAVGFAAATAFRGVRLIRVPTTVLAQADSAVGVKNAINYSGRKNGIGTFMPPAAVINDLKFLDKLPDRDWIAGTIEAVKVALIRDAAFFAELERLAPALVERDPAAMERLVIRSAELHTNHIAGGDAFEMGSARPLDFGHWAAHKLETMSAYRLRHGEAVAIGIALDSIYSRLEGRLPAADCSRIIKLVSALGFELWAPELALREPREPGGMRAIIAGLEEFREKLGGRLTITLLDRIGAGVETHHMDLALVEEALSELEDTARAVRHAGTARQNAA
jgi:3-dehydroquinate synthase